MLSPFTEQHYIDLDGLAKDKPTLTRTSLPATISAESNSSQTSWNVGRHALQCLFVGHATEFPASNNPVRIGRIVVKFVETWRCETLAPENLGLDPVR